MRVLTTQEQNTIEAFTELVTRTADADVLAMHLEKMLWGYALYMLQDEDLSGHPNNTESLYYAKLLVDVLKTE